MVLLLIPGFWLNASSWDPIVEILRAKGHDPIPITLPGMASRDDERLGLTLADYVEAIVREIDRASGPVVLVGHSAGGAIAHAAADARPDRVARVIYVDSIPLGEGDCVNDELAEANDEIPLPDWSVFGSEDLVDLDDEIRARFRDIAIPVPVRVARDAQVLRNPRRYEVAATIIACEFTADQLRTWIDEGQSWVAEVGAMTNVTVVDLPTGHWPQFTKPTQLAQVIADAVDSDAH